MKTPDQINVAGTNISATSYQQVVELCREWAGSDKNQPSRYICVTSVHGIIEARGDMELRTALRQADIVTPDGMPVVWALRSFGVRGQQRVYGPTLMLHLCSAAVEDSLRIFLFGARTQTLVDLQKRLQEQFKGLNIVGSMAPPFRPMTEEEERQFRSQIALAEPDILFVGLSTPKQEKWMLAHRSTLPSLTMVGVGAAFDIHAGRTRQAPPWMQRSGFEWFFRLVTEPTRLWRRYLLVTPQFIPLWLYQLLFKRTGW